jgi:FMN phosphatase YigB (HAD superfamily)
MNETRSAPVLHTRTGNLFLPPSYRVDSTTPLLVSKQSSTDAPFVLYQRPLADVVLWDIYGVWYQEGRSPGVVDVVEYIRGLTGFIDSITIEQTVFGPADGIKITKDQLALRNDRITPEVFMMRSLAKLGLPLETAQYMAHEILTWYQSELTKHLNDALFPIVRTLRLNGVFSGIITDRTILAGKIAERIPGFLTRDNFITILQSYETRTLKPNEKVYRAAMRRSREVLGRNIAPSSFVMVDDREHNLVPDPATKGFGGALGAGMLGILYGGDEDVRKKNADLVHLLREMRMLPRLRY